MLAMDGRHELQRVQKNGDYRIFTAPVATNPKVARMNLDSKAPISTTIPAAVRRAEDDAPHMHRHMWIVTGTAGSGKTTVAQYLAEQLQVPYIEGDDYHPPSNREKMARNTPLTDTDRWDWLITLREAAVRSLGSSPTHTGVVVTCSALKRKYRDVIRVAAYDDHGVAVHFIYLHAPEAVLRARVAARRGHFMGAGMVQSQFESLEAPGAAELGRDVLSCDCSAELQEVERHVLAKVRKVLAEDRAGYGSEEW